MGYEDVKDLPRRTAADKVLHYKAFNTAKNPKYYEYQRGLASTVHTFFDKKTSNTNKRTGIGSENKELVEELNKLVIRKFQK